VSTLRLGTRGSRLALVQAEAVARRMEAAHPGLAVQLVEIRTSGDRIQDVPLGPALGQAFFTKEIEEALKAGRLPAIVATSSLELGIDMGAVDLVVQVESPGSVASGLQRIGRAGHQVGDPLPRILKADRHQLRPAGRTSHEDIVGGLQLFADEVMPEFHAREEAHQAWKAKVLAGEIELEEIDTTPFTKFLGQPDEHLAASRGAAEIKKMLEARESIKR